VLHWSKTKERKLVRLYPTTEVEDIAKMLKVPISFINSKAQELELEKQKMSEWTDAELDILIALYPTISNWAIAERLNMTNNSDISTQAFRLGLRKDKSYFINRDTEQETKLLAQWNEGYSKKEHKCSRGHYILGKILKHDYPQFHWQDEEPIGKLRLDWFTKDLDLGFEFQGSQHLVFNDFHFKNMQAFKDAQENDMKKSYLAESMGIRLVHVYYDEDLNFSTIRQKIKDVL
jgi:hypothetical protein